MNAPKYDPPVGEARIALGGSEPRVRLDLVHGNDVDGATIDHEVTFVTVEVARQEQQRIALTIADRVHGRELEDLREQCRVALGHVRSLRDGMIELLRANDSDVLVGDCVALAFDNASQYLGLPISDDKNVPAELRASRESPCEPTMERLQDQYLVTWGPGDKQQAIFKRCSDAATCFGEHYARWREAVR